jgi:hypothetical protein
MDCKIITIEGEGKDFLVEGKDFLVGIPDCCQRIEIQ